MTTIRVIQLGDVHYPKAKTEVVGDLKDMATTVTLRDAISPKKLKRVFGELDRVKNEQSPCGLLICGDLTTYGDLSQYAECVTYLTNNARLNDAAVSPRDHWHVVPGNHDVARTALAPNAAPFPSLFLPLSVEWNRNFNPPALTFENARQSTLLDSGCGVQLYSLNSCVGCGEWRHIPAKVRAAVTDNIKDLLETAPNREIAFDTIAEQLDAPMFHDDHVDYLCTHLKSLDHKLLPLVLAHHNLLPQATPRLEIYTELLNGGVLRTRLTSLGRPIIYCHGHIHDDPIEVVTSPNDDAGLLVIVAAPLATDGFNLLTIHFGRNRAPIGLEVVRHRLRNNGDVFKDSPIRFSLCPRQLQSTALDADILDVVKASDWTMRPVQEVRSKFNQATNRSVQYGSLRDLLIEAEWFGLVQLSNRDASDPRELRVQRTIP